MTPKHLAEWEEERKQGRWRFILTRGVGLWALLGLIIGVYWHFPEGGVPGVKDGWRTVAWWVLWVGLVGGSIFGSAVWLLAEAEYRKAKEADRERASDGPGG